MVAAHPSTSPRTAPPHKPWHRALGAWLGDRSHIRRLTITSQGKWVAFLAVALGVAAINTGNNLLYLLVGWLLSFIVASGVLSEWALRHVELERRIPSVVFAGEAIEIELVVRNRHTTRAAFSLEVQELVGDAPLDKRCYFLRVGPTAQQSATYRHIFTERGLRRLTGLQISTRFPFGFFHKHRTIELVTEVLVLPARVPVRGVPPRPTRRGETPSAKVGRDGEFYGIREQRLGDDRRAIHWSSTAKMGRYMVREREQDQAHQATIYVENGAARPELDRMAVHAPDGIDHRMGYERGISYAASLAVFYLERGYLVEVSGRGIAVPPGSGRGHIAAVLRSLATLPFVTMDTPWGASRLPHATRVFVRPRIARGGGVPDAMVVEV